MRILGWKWRRKGSLVGWAILSDYQFVLAHLGEASILKGLISFSPALRGTSYAGLPAIRFATLKGLNSVGVLRILIPMAQSLGKILVHIVFSTKERRPFLRDKALREEMHLYLGGILMNLDCQPIIVGGAEIIKEVKRGSSLWIKTKSDELQDFAWQSGYGIFSVGFSQIDSVRGYIAGQEEHHQKISFQDEFRKFLERYEVEFDERYVWD